MRVPRATRVCGWLATVVGLSFAVACGDGDSEGNADGGEGGDTSEGGDGGDGGDGGAGNNSGGGGAGGTSSGNDGGAIGGANGGGTTDPEDDGGVSGNGTGGNNNGGGGNNNGGGGSGNGGGGTGSGATVEDIIAAVCGQEFRCCDDGEIDWRLSPFAETAADCEERISFQLTSNNTNNPYVSGPAAPGGILGLLAYRVDLSRVAVNEDGAEECAEQWDDTPCATAGDPDARCDGPAEEDPCALTHIFDPILEEGDECTPELAESATANDVECVEGTTCADVGDPDNPNDVPTCVQRGLEGDPCANDGDCDFDFYCDSGDCTLKGDPGDPCSFNDPDSPAPGDEDAQCKAGLTCHPVDFECVESCTLGFTCATAGGDADAACPADSGCAPIEVDEATTAFRVCTELGDSAADLCNSEADCAADRYCDGSNCQARKNLDAACADHNECAEGLHCDLVGATTVNTCQTNLSAMDACTEDYQCGPASAGCLNGGSDGLACRNNLLANGAPCGDDESCDSDFCEFEADDSTETTCVPGLDTAGAPCDAVLGDGTATRCNHEYICFGDDTVVEGGECLLKAQPGTSCIDPDDMPNASLCANESMCVDQWDEGETCNDGPVPEQNGGTNLTCDGN